MSNGVRIPEQIQQINSLQEHGQLEKAEKSIVSLLSEDLRMEDRLSLRLLFSSVLLGRGKLLAGFKEAEEVWESTEDSKNRLLRFDAGMLKAQAQLELERYGELRLIIADCENLLLAHEDLAVGELDRRDAAVKFFIGEIGSHVGDLPVSLHYHNESLRIRTDLSEKMGMCESLRAIGDVFMMNDEFDTARQYFERSLQIARDEKNAYQMARVLNKLGSVCLKGGDHKRALKFYHSALRSWQRLNHKPMIARSEGDLGIAYFADNDMDNAVLHFYQSLQGFELLGRTFRVAVVHEQLGHAFWKLGILDTAIQHLMISLEMYEELDELDEIDGCLQLVGLIHQCRGELDEALEYLSRGLALREALDRKIAMVESHVSIGELLTQKGELVKGLEHFQHSLDVAEQTNSKTAMAHALRAIGWGHQHKGNLDQALQFVNLALGLAIETKDQSIIAHCSQTLGGIYADLDNLEKAFEHFATGLQICEQLENDNVTASILYRLVLLSVDRDFPSVATAYLERLKDIETCAVHPRIRTMSKLAGAYTLKASGRARMKFRAQEKFREVAEQKGETAGYLRVFALLNLCDLMLFELRSFGEEAVIEEVKEVVSSLMDVFQSSQSYSVLVETYLLRSELALLELNPTQARELLTQAQILADEMELGKLAMRVSHYHDALLGQMTKWEDLIEREASIAERLELAHLEDMVVQMIRKKTEEIEELPETPVLLLLTQADSGLAVFSESFIEEDADADFKLHDGDQLIGALIQAVSAMSTEIFSSSGKLERITHEDYTLVLKAREPVLFSYAFRGPSYPAAKKLDAFIERLEKDEFLWPAVSRRTVSVKAHEYTALSEVAKDVILG